MTAVGWSFQKPNTQPCSLQAICSHAQPGVTARPDTQAQATGPARWITLLSESSPPLHDRAQQQMPLSQGSEPHHANSPPSDLQTRNTHRYLHPSHPSQPHDKPPYQLTQQQTYRCCLPVLTPMIPQNPRVTGYMATTVGPLLLGPCQQLPFSVPDTSQNRTWGS